MKELKTIIGRYIVKSHWKGVIFKHIHSFLNYFNSIVLTGINCPIKINRNSTANQKKKLKYKCNLYCLIINGPIPITKHSNYKWILNYIKRSTKSTTYYNKAEYHISWPIKAQVLKENVKKEHK